MAYLLVKGQFELCYWTTKRVGSQPDGDSMWFKPDNPELLADIRERSAKLNKGGFAQLRYEAIDALELHFEGAEQNHALSSEARECNTGEVGFESVEYSPKLYLTVRNCMPAMTRGYILTRSIDPYGRPVSFVFTGNTPKRDGQEYFLGEEWLDESVNAQLARGGEAYPAFYTGLPGDLRRHTLELIKGAVRRKLGLWKSDLSTKGFRAENLDELEVLAVWPKMFRRLTSYFKSGEVGLDDFDAWLRSQPSKDDDLWIVSKGEKAFMHSVIDVRGDKLRMLYPPDDLIIVPQ